MQFVLEKKERKKERKTIKETKQDRSDTLGFHGGDS
jgi:hypothetical protein